jgi:hypothetical protein
VATLAPMPAHLEPLTYAALPWQTHPIDTAPDQPQGWGPMSGPWMPVQYQDPSQSIDCDWTQTNNINTKTAPQYTYESLYDDPSLGNVNNQSWAVNAVDAAETMSHAATSTIANVVRSNTGMGRVLSALGVTRG